LERSGAVGHSKEHHEGFKEATIGVEGRLPFISRLDVHIVETPPDVKFCEVLGSAELGDEFRDKGERIPVLDSLSQTSFGHISINSSSILTVSMATESP